jgi:hypothetical protein
MYWPHFVDCVWNVMAHGDALEEKWRGNKRMEWVTSKRHMTAEHRLARAVQTLQTDVHSSPAGSRLNWRPCRFKGLVRFVERRNLISARVPSHFKRSLPHYHQLLLCFTSVWMMPCFVIICILDLFFVVAGTVVCFFVHFLICPLCFMLCQIFSFYLVSFIVSYSLEYDFSCSTIILLLLVVSSMGFFFSIIYGLLYSYLLVLVLLYTWNTIFFIVSSVLRRIRWLHLLTVSVVILMVDGIGDGPEFPRCGYRSLVAQ